jgi:hypothetical protein
MSVIVLILNQYYIEGAKTEIIKIWKNLVKFDLHSFSRYQHYHSELWYQNSKDGDRMGTSQKTII